MWRDPGVCGHAPTYVDGPRDGVRPPPSPSCKVARQPQSHLATSRRTSPAKSPEPAPGGPCRPLRQHPERVRCDTGPVVHLVEQFAVPSRLITVFVALFLCDQCKCLSRHASFRGAGEQWLTTRIQPSTFEASTLQGAEDCASFGPGPMVGMRSAVDARSTARLGVANKPSTIGRVREPMGSLMNDLPEGASACPS